MSYKCNTATCPPVGLILKYDIDTGTITDDFDTPVTLPDSFGADNIKFFGVTDTSSDVPGQGTATTQLISTDTFNAASVVRTSSAIPTIPELTHTGPVDVTELEYVIQLDTDASVGAVYSFRLYEQDGTAFTTYTQTGTATVRAHSAGSGF